MSKVILKFTKSHGPYVKGDIAGFDPEKAAKLKGVAVPYDAKAEKKVAELDDLAQREADIAAREAALAEREAELADGAAPASDDAKAKKAAGGAPPAQGADAAAKK